VVFGINFALYFKVVTGGWRESLANEELHWFLGIFGGVVLLMTLYLLPVYDGSFLTSLRYASFQTASLMSTTGYATADFTLWPAISKVLLMMVMFTGSCAGSTAGGMKICRVGMLCKQGIREVRRTFQPRKVQVVRFEGKAVDESVLSQVAVFSFMYILLIVIGAILISLEAPQGDLNSFESSFTAALTCMSNVGPGLSPALGPNGGFAGYGPFATSVMILLMLAGRLEIFPLLALFHPAMWRK